MNKKTKKHFRRFCKVFAAMLLTVVFLYGAVLVFMTVSVTRSVRHAKAEYPTVSVRITEMQHAFKSPFWYNVTLRTDSDTDTAVAGNTYAQTLNYHLEVGDTLTMYYDPKNTDERIVDFGSTSFVFFVGGCLMGLSLLGGIAMVYRRIRRRRHRTPAVHMAQ